MAILLPSSTSITSSIGLLAGMMDVMGHNPKQHDRPQNFDHESPLGAHLLPNVICLLQLPPSLFGVVCRLFGMVLDGIDILLLPIDQRC